MSILIQAGHVNIQENCDWGLRGQTGAHGEAIETAKVAGMVAGALHAHGLDAAVVDANANCDGRLMAQDWGAVVSLHCDARGWSGFAVGPGNPAEDGAATASHRLAECLRSSYASATGLHDLDDLGENENVLEYYLFNTLSATTPFALIEMGAIADPSGGFGPDELYLSMHAEDVANGIVNGILDFLQVGAEREGGTPRTTEGIPVVTPPNLQGPPPALIPSSVRNLPDALTNLYQAKTYSMELLEQNQQDANAQAEAAGMTPSEYLVAVRPTLVAIVNELNTALGLLEA